MFQREKCRGNQPGKTTVPAPYALAKGVPALQVEPSRIRTLLLTSFLLALLGGAVTGYVCGRRAGPPASGEAWR